MDGIRTYLRAGCALCITVVLCAASAWAGDIVIKNVEKNPAAKPVEQTAMLTSMNAGIIDLNAVGSKGSTGANDMIAGDITVEGTNISISNSKVTIQAAQPGNGDKSLSDLDITAKIRATGNLNISNSNITLSSSTTTHNAQAKLDGGTVNISSSKIVMGGRIESAEQTASGKTVVLSNGTQIVASNGAVFAGTSDGTGNQYNQKFHLDRSSTLDMSEAGIKFENFSSDKEGVVLDGTLIFGAGTTVTVVNGLDGTPGQQGDSAGVTLSSTAQLYLAPGVQKGQTLISGNEQSDFGAYEHGAYSKQTAYGLYRLETTTTQNSKTLNVDVANEASTAVRTSAFDANVARMYGSGVASNNGFMNTLFYSTAPGTGAAQGTDTLLISNGSSAGDRHYANMQRIAWEGDSRSLAEMYTGIHLSKVMQANQDTVRQNVMTVASHVSEIRREMADKGINSQDAFAMAQFTKQVGGRVWGALTGMWEKGKATNGFEGFDYDNYGLQLGYDGQAGPLTVGGSFAYTYGKLKNKAFDSDNSKLYNYSLNAYGTYSHPTHFFFTGMLGYTRHSNELKFTAGGQSTNDKWSADSVYIEARAGYDYVVKGFRLNPYLGLGWVGTYGGKHSAAGISYDKNKSKTGYLPIGLDVEYDVAMGSGMLTLLGNMNYTHNFTNNGVTGNMRLTGLVNSVSGSTVEYGISSTKRGKYLFNMGLGARYATEAWDLGLKYDYFTRSAARAHRLALFAGYNF